MLITLFFQQLLLDSDLKATAFFETSYKITLIDKPWLLSHLSSQKRNTMLISLKVRDIKVSKHKFTQFIILLLYFLSKNTTK